MKTLRMLIMPVMVLVKTIEWIFRTSAKIINGVAGIILKGSNGIQSFLGKGSLVLTSLIILFLLSALAGAL